MEREERSLSHFSESSKGVLCVCVCVCVCVCACVRDSVCASVLLKARKSPGVDTFFPFQVVSRSVMTNFPTQAKKLHCQAIELWLLFFSISAFFFLKEERKHVP